MDMTGFAIQVGIFAVFMMAFSYFITRRKAPNRLQSSLFFSVISTVIYAIIIYFWQVG